MGRARTETSSSELYGQSKNRNQISRSIIGYRTIARIETRTDISTVRTGTRAGNKTIKPISETNH